VIQPAAAAVARRRALMIWTVVDMKKGWKRIFTVREAAS
jgi:hypothetical protein